MTTARRVIPVIVLFLQIHSVVSQVVASKITVPAPGFTKKALEFVQVTTELAWVKAADVCSKDYNGHLVRVNTPEEKALLQTFVDEHSVANHFWIGMQWSEGAKLWNDGSCTPVNSAWYNYKDSGSETFSNSDQCFAAHDTSKLEWEAFGCMDDKHFVCERRQTIYTEDLNISFYVVFHNDSNKDACSSMCIELEDCFISSPIENACIVGLSSDTSNTTVIVVGGAAAGQTVSGASSTAQAKNKPTVCSTGSGTQGEVTTTLNNYTLVNGLWKVPTLNDTFPECSQGSPLVSLVYVTQTVTETAVQMTTTESPINVNTCSPLIEATTIIQPTTVTQVMTSVAIETTTIPAYVTMTTQVAGSSCVNSIGITTVVQATTVTEVMTSVIVETTTVPAYLTLTTHGAASSCLNSNAVYTTTVNSCNTQSASVGIVPSTTVQATSTPSPDVENSDITNRIRLEIYGSLQLNKDDLSKTIRAKNSAENKLVSSVAIGFSFSLMCVIFIAIIVLSDMRAILSHVKSRMWVNLRSRSRVY